MTNEQEKMIERLLECDFFTDEAVKLKKYIYNRITQKHVEISAEHINESEDTQTIYLRGEAFEYATLEHMELDEKMIFYIFNLKY